MRDCSDDIWAKGVAIARLGQTLGPEVLTQVQSLYRDVHVDAAAGRTAAAVDELYGEDERQTLDVYLPEFEGASPAPVVLWVHGGGFVRGDKGGRDNPFNAHVGRWAARRGLVGVVMNYRLAPTHVWPTGGEDVGLAIDWIRDNAAVYGGDPERIVAVGTSAGATHIAQHLASRPNATRLAGAVLLSALYGITPPSERDEIYYGDPAQYSVRCPLAAVVAATLPLFVAGAEYDPPRFQTELIGFLAARLKCHGMMPPASVVAGHNHFSLACHLGTNDTRLSDQIFAFINGLTGEPA